MIRIIFIGLCCWVWLMPAIAQVPLVGRVIDQSTGLPVAGATVLLREYNLGVQSKEDGSFTFRVKDNSSKLQLQVSSVGFETRLLTVVPGTDTLLIALSPFVATLQEIVYSASRTPEKILRSPVSVEKLNAKSFREMAGVSFHDELRQLKGLDLVSTGLNFKQVNSRGFASTFNWRFLQLVDDIDNQSPALGWSYANIFSPPDLDIESVEFIPGAASALYGPIAFTGLLNTRTKDPFKYTGIALQVKSGLNHIGEVASPVKLYKDFSFRYAHKISSSVAFKINVAYLGGLDFFANDSTDVNPKTPLASRGASNPARDALNFYGDEIQKLIPGVGLVSRTGYRETEVADYDVYTLRTSAALHLKLKGQAELILQQNYNRGNANFTGTSRFSLRNMQVFTSRVEWKGKNFFWRAYRVGEDMGDSYNTRSLSQLINNRWVRDLDGREVAPELANQTWFNRYEAAYKGLVNGITPNSPGAARVFADQGRYLPGSVAFQEAKEAIIHTYQGRGAAYFTQSNYLHTEGQYNFQNVFHFLDVLVGGNMRRYANFSNGTLYADSSKKVRLSEYGLFIRGTKELFDQKLKLTASLRYDKNPNFKFNLSPRFSMVYEVAKDHYLRASYQTGFRNPSLIEQYLNLRIGQLSLVGGVPGNASGLNVYKNALTTSSVEAFFTAVYKSVGAGQTLDQAIEQHRGLLQLSNVPYIRPELQRTVEIGYKSELSRKLVLDVNVDYSDYSNFAVNAFTTKPNSPILTANNTISTQAITDLFNSQFQNYQLYTNSSQKARALFFSAGVTYYLYKKYIVSGNVNFSRLYTSSNASVNEVAPFNTPAWSSNLSFSNNELGKGYGFKINWHWQDVYDWYGTFNGNRPGRINAFSLIDLQVHKIVSESLQLKLGASNVLNHPVSQTYGSPRVGAVYYLSLLWESGGKR